MSFKVKQNSVKNLAGASDKLKELRGDISYVLAKATADHIRENILGQHLNLREKSKRWAKRAKDPRPLVHTRRYVNGIQAVRLQDGRAAIEGNKQLMKWLEYGTRTMKPLPHVRPSIRQLNKELNGLLSKKVIDELFSG